MLTVARRCISTGLVFAFAAFLILAESITAGAAGYWNVPSTFCQCCGCGFGGGYHAPLILGPPTYECFAGPNEVRVPHAPNPYACAPYCNGGCNAAAPAAMTRVAHPSTMPNHVTPAAATHEELPSSEPPGALFAPPVQP
jgi:hypothetical protein